MVTKKQNKGGAGKFFLGAALGAALGALASKIVKITVSEEENDDCEQGHDCDCKECKCEKGEVIAKSAEKVEKKAEAKKPEAKKSETKKTSEKK